MSELPQLPHSQRQAPETALRGLVAPFARRPLGGGGRGGWGWARPAPGREEGQWGPPGGEEEAQPGTSPGRSGSGFSPGVAGGIKGTWSWAASRSAASRPAAGCTRLSQPSAAAAAMVSLVSRPLPTPRLAPCRRPPRAEDAGTGSRRTPKSGHRRSGTQEPWCSGELGLRPRFPSWPQFPQL